MVKTKAIVIFLLLTGIVIATMIISYNLGVGKSKAKPTTTSSQVITSSEQVNQDRAQEVKLQQRLQEIEREQDRAQEVKLQQQLREIEREVNKRRDEILQNYNRRASDSRNDAHEQRARSAEEKAEKKKVARDKYQSELYAIENGSYGRQDREKMRIEARRDYDDEIKRINKKFEDGDNYHDYLEFLVKQRQNALYELEQLKQDWIADAEAKSKSPHRADSITSPPSRLRDSVASETKIVNGIIVFSEKPSALIGTELVRQGEKLGDVTIVSISKDVVEFEKNGNRWTQKVGDVPSSYWAEPNQ